MATFVIHPLDRFVVAKTAIKRPREIAYFSYDDEHTLHPLSDKSLSYYYPPFVDVPADGGQQRPRISLSNGFDAFQKHDDSVDEHLVALLDTLASYEEREGHVVKADLITWRGMMTKIVTAPFDMFSEFEMNATCFQGTIFLEEHKAAKFTPANNGPPKSVPHGARPSQDMMQYWGYKFEVLSTLRKPWAEVSRGEIESRDNVIVSNEAQYCSIVTTGIGDTNLILGGEVDAVMGTKPDNADDPIPWVELKTSQQPVDQRDDIKYERKLLKFWAQSFLLGVPKIIVGFRSPDGHLLRLQEHETQKIPGMVKRQGQGTWDGNICINFAATVLEFFKANVTGDGIVWRISRKLKSGTINVFPIEDVSDESIVKPSFKAHRERMLAKEVAAKLNPAG
ncbi:decapping endonuclease targeting mRNA [Oleoguttula sp. CCFEE 5521]